MFPKGRNIVLNDTGHSVEENLIIKLAAYEVMSSGFSVFTTHTHWSNIKVMYELEFTLITKFNTQALNLFVLTCAVMTITSLKL